MKTLKLECDRDALVKALGLVGDAIDNKSTIPILAYVLLRAKGKTVEVVGTDLITKIIHTIEARVVGRGSVEEFTLPWHDLRAALKNCTDPTLRIEVKDLKAEIRCGNVSLTFEALPPQDFPTALSDMKLPTVYAVNAEDLGQIIKTVRHAISEEEARFYLHGAFFHCLKNGVLRLVTTDGHRLVVDEIAAPSGLTPEALPIIVPAETLYAVQHHCKAIPGSVIVSSGLDGICFDFGYGCMVLSKRIDGTYPDYSRVIPNGDGNKCRLLATIDADAFDDALRQLPPGKGKFKQRAVKLTFKNKKLTLSQQATDDAPGANLSVPCDCLGPAFEIGFNPRYLRDALAVLGNQIGLAFADKDSPVLMVSGEMPQVVIMPMRV